MKSTAASILVAAMSVLISHAGEEPPQSRAAWGEPAAGSFAAVRRQIKIRTFQQQVDGAVVTSEFLQSTRFVPTHGRAFVQDEFLPGAHNVVILHPEIARKGFGDESRSVGATIQIDGVDFIVVAVAPANFNIPAGARFWLPNSSAASTSPTASSPDSALKKFGWFADVVGSCWVGTFPDGKTQHTHCYTSQFGQFIRGTATLAAGITGRMEDRFSGDSLFAWSEADKRIVYYIWGSDGSHSRHEAFYTGEDLAFPINSRAEPAKVSYRSLWRRIDADTIEVRREVPDGAAWKTELTVTYRRQRSR